MFTSDRAKMGEFASPGWVKVLAWIVAVVIAALNVWLLYQTFASTVESRPMYQRILVAVENSAADARSCARRRSWRS